jgi:hypothetical protein
MRTLKTSDNTIYKIETDEQLESIKKSCADNGVKLFENDKEIELKKKTKE